MTFEDRARVVDQYRIDLLPGEDGVARMALNAVLEYTTYEGLKTSCLGWHGDMTDIADQR